MDSHNCLHETELSRLTIDLSRVVVELETNNKHLERITKIIDGNGHDGIYTKVSKHNDWIKRRSKIELIFAAAIIGLILKAAWPLL